MTIETLGIGKMRVATRAAGTGTDLADVDLYVSSDPVPVWAQLRREGGVHRNERVSGEPFWAVLGYDLAASVLRDPATFLSGKDIRLDQPSRGDEIRWLINSALTLRVVHGLRDTMRAAVAASVDEALRRGSCDLTRLAARLPAAVVCDMLGVPKPDWDFLFDCMITAFGSTGISRLEREVVAGAHADLGDYLYHLLVRRRAQPGNDVLSVLIHSQGDGAALTDDEILDTCEGLIAAANETTRHAAVGGILALMRNPVQWQRLRADPGLLATAVPEILRYTSPAMQVLRTAARDTVLGGRSIRAGDQVAVWLPSANRDETVFADPDRFDVSRTPNRHLALARGTRFGLGSTLAVTELTVLFGEFLREVGYVEHSGDVCRLRSNRVWGYESVPVTLAQAI